MKVLAIDTSNLVLGVAVASEERLLGEVATNLQKNHSIRLMPTIALLLEQLGTPVTELNGIAVAKGPGSYTGLRIGVTTAKVMAWALSLPLAGVSSLEALAANGAFFPGAICPIFDARRKRVYTGLYKNVDGEIVNVKAERVVALDVWLDELENDNEPVLFLGDDVSVYKEEIAGRLKKNAVFAAPEHSVTRAGHIARIGLKRIVNNNVEDVANFAPNYLQLAEVEAKWLCRGGGT
jgi:tRNA threonylcarbamoyladenosine biosynthesis protein TsaB